MAYRFGQWFRFIPDGTSIPFMNGRFWGLGTSAVLSILSVVLFIWPGPNLGIDFTGGIVTEIRLAEKADFNQLRHEVDALGVGDAYLQAFGSEQDVLMRLPIQEGGDAAQQQAVEKIRQTMAANHKGSEIRRVEVVGPTVSGELIHSGALAIGLGFLGMLIYIWVRFEWQYAIGAVATLLLDSTKLMGFFTVVAFQFNLSSIAAVLTIIGYSMNDKVVVYDRVRENLRKYKNMPLRQVIDLSINETLSRTIGTSVTTFLAILPMTILGEKSLREFAIALEFGIVVGTSSSIFIAAPLLLLLGEGRLRKTIPATQKKTDETLNNAA
ncbi:MAG: protein translocase subunit SecF [Alphaproteobacteria bacterium]